MVPTEVGFNHANTTLFGDSIVIPTWDLVWPMENYHTDGILT